MSKHTPGPWNYHFEPRDHYSHKIRSKPGLICQLPGWVPHDELRLEQEANGRLIAAAPELLEALEATHGLFQATLLIMRDKEASAIAKDQLDKNRAAIAKATGEHHE